MLFLSFFLVQPPDQPTLWTIIFRNMMEAAWGARPRGKCEAAHPTDLRTRGAFAFRDKIPNRIGIKTMRSSCGSYDSYPKFYTCWKIRILFFFFLSQHCLFTMYNLSHQCQMCHKFQYFGHINTGIETNCKKK
jgi:hypothetical protein